MKSIFTILAAAVGILLFGGCAVLSDRGAADAALHPIVGGSPDYTRARELYKVGAANGDAISQAKYAAMCLVGLGGPVDTTDALANVRAAEKQGSPLAAALLADLYSRGEPNAGIDQNIAEGLAYAHRAEANNKAALAPLVARLERQKRGEPTYRTETRTPRRSPTADGPPEFMEEVYPEYPTPLWVLGIGATVTVDLSVATDGTPRNVHVVSPTLPQFDAAAVNAVSRTKFLPGRKAGQPVSTHIELPISFGLN